MKDIEGQPKLYISGQIGPKGGFMAMLCGEEPFSASDVRTFLDNNKEAKDIVVEISSDGGYKNEGIEIYNLLRNSGKNVTTIAYKANSIATVVMLAGKKRLIVKNSQFVIHFARINPMNLGMDDLTSEDLQRLADETDKSDNQILDIYCDTLGAEKRTELQNLMKEETDLGSKGAIKYGFATGYYENKKSAVPTKDDFVGVCINEYAADLIQNYMETKKEKDDAKTFADKVLNGFKNIVKYVSGIKNDTTLTMSDGSSLYFVPADASKPDDLNGATVTTVDADGIPTTDKPADGDHTAEDGTVYSIADGVVTAVTPAVDAKKQADEVAALKAELKAAQDLNKAKDTEIANFKTETNKIVNQLRNDFIEFKKRVPGEKSQDDDSSSNSSAKKVSDSDAFQNMSYANRVITLRKEQLAESRKK